MTKKHTLESLQTLASLRNHRIRYLNDYKDVNSMIQIYCNTCSTQWPTTVRSYLNAKQTGCPECKKLAISKAQKNKTVSEDTKKLIGEKASQRPGSLTGVTGSDHPRFKHGINRDFKNPSTEEYIWKNAVRKKFQYKCAITGSREELITHHLNGWNLFPEQRYDVMNGVLITKSIHKQFHDLYKYGNNTESQWVEFCEQYYHIDWVALKQNYFELS